MSDSRRTNLRREDADVLNPMRWGGPIFEFELLTTSRRGRYFAIRSAYALILLILIWQMNLIWITEYGSDLTPSLATKLALTIFGEIILSQEILILALTPALVSGVIVSEMQRKTLHYLMTSTLGSFEIVFGKLLARLLHIGVLLGVALPIMSLLVLMGGVDIRLVLLCTAWTVSTAFFLCSLSVFVSVHSKTTREALFLAYMLELLWLIVPEVGLTWMAKVFPTLFDFLLPANDWLMAASPVSVARRLLMSRFTSMNLVEDLSWMILINLGVGFTLSIYSALRLRAVFRAHSDAPKRSLTAILTARGSELRANRRPPCTDSPVAWKERYTSVKTRLVRILSTVTTLMLGVPLIYYLGIFGIPAWEESRHNGYLNLHTWIAWQERYEFMYFLQMIIPLIFLCGFFGVGADASASITSEHENDTWLSLTATEVTAKEVVFGKLIGALRTGVKFLALMIVSTSLGVATGALHPLSLLTQTLEGAVFLTFGATFGVWISMFLKSTWRAQFLTIGLLFLISLIGQTLLNIFHYPPIMIWPGFFPAEISRAIIDPHSIQDIREYGFGWSEMMQFGVGNSPAWNFAFGVLSILIYGGLAVACVWSSIRTFDRAAGRPKRSKRAIPSGDSSSRLNGLSSVHEIIPSAQPASPS